MKHRLGIVILAFALASCGTDNKLKVQELETQLENAKTQLKTAQLQIDASTSTVAALKTQLSELQTELQQQSIKCEEQRKTIEAQKAQVEDLTGKVKKLYGPTSSAIQLLEDFVIHFTATKTSSEADKQCKPVYSRLSEIATDLPLQCRAAVVLNSTIQLLQSYPKNIFEDSAPVDTETANSMVTSVALLVSGKLTAEESGRAIVCKENADKARDIMRIHSSEFKEKIKDCVSLLKEQRQLMD